MAEQKEEVSEQTCGHAHEHGPVLRTEVVEDGAWVWHGHEGEPCVQEHDASCYIWVGGTEWDCSPTSDNYNSCMHFVPDALRQRDGERSADSEDMPPFGYRTWDAYHWNDKKMRQHFTEATGDREPEPYPGGDR